ATATVLGDGRVVAFSGLRSNGSTNRSVEIFDPRSASTPWTSPATAPFTPPLYPRMFLLPNGNVFYTGQGSGTRNTNSWILTPTTPPTWASSAATTRNRDYGAHVLLPLYPPAYAPKVMS